MAATYTVTFRNDDEWDIEDVDHFQFIDGLVSALDEDGKVVALFPVQSLTGIVRCDEDEDGGDDGESADEDRASVYNIMNFSPAYPPLMKTA